VEKKKKKKKKKKKGEGRRHLLRLGIKLRGDLLKSLSKTEETGGRTRLQEFSRTDKLIQT